MVRTHSQFEYFVPPIPQCWSLLSQAETALPHLVVQVPHLVVQVAHLVDTACSARVSAGGKVSYKEACARLGTEPVA